MVCSSCGSNEAMYCARCFHSSSGRTAENTVGTQPTDVQQLKAEIAALVQEHFLVSDCGVSYGHIGVFITKLRQLTAV